MELFLALVGFAIASYAIVANDAIQTLGTFLSSNSKRPWWVLWLFAFTILVVVLVYGWVTHGGDVSYGRLAKVPPPETMTWIYIVPPIALLILTRLGIPVSTTFLVLTIFAPQNLWSMVTKSAFGYLVAFAVAILVYSFVLKGLEKKFLDSSKDTPSQSWVVLQWLSTGFLWSQWLIQDLANIFVYLPRQLPLSYLIMGIAGMGTLLGYTFYTSGGHIQKIVTSKTNTTDIRSATIIDFFFGLTLLFFKEWSKIPMSTTWVFLGVIGGREIALTARMKHRPFKETARLVVGDGAKALSGLVVSVILALGLPKLAPTPASTETSAPASPSAE